MMAPIHMSIPQMKEAAGLGALIEFVYNGLIGHYKEFTFADYAKAIRAEIPEALYESGRSQLSVRLPKEPARRFAAIVRAADVLLSVIREAEADAEPVGAQTAAA